MGAFSCELFVWRYLAAYKTENFSPKQLYPRRSHPPPYTHKSGFPRPANNLDMFLFLLLFSCFQMAPFCPGSAYASTLQPVLVTCQDRPPLCLSNQQAEGRLMRSACSCLWSSSWFVFAVHTPFVLIALSCISTSLAAIHPIIFHGTALTKLVNVEYEGETQVRPACIWA